MMVLHSSKIRGFITSLLLVTNALKSTTAASQQDYDQPFSESFADLNENILFSELPLSSKSSLEPKNAQQIIERPCNIWSAFNGLRNSSDLKMYKEIHQNGEFKRLCWAELLIITEDNITRNRTLSSEYSIILDNQGDVIEDEKNGKITEQCEIWDENTKERKFLNFTVTRKTNDVTVKEHKIMFCGMGPVLTKIYVELPKLNKKRIEIRLSPAINITWKLSEDTRLTEPIKYNTFDTTITNEYPIFTREMTTENTLQITYDPMLQQENMNEDKKFKINSNKSTSLLYESGETFNPINSNSNTENNYNIEDNTLRYIEDHSTSDYPAHDDGILGDNNHIDENDPNFQDNVKSKSDDNFVQPSTFLLDLLLPNQVKKNLLRQGNHTILSNIKVHLEHRTVDNVTNHEKTESVVNIEGNSMYRIAVKQF